MANIPVNANDRVVIVTATSDNQTDFDFDFLAFTIEQLSATKIALSDGAETTLVATTDFTATDLNNANGGTISLISTSIVIGDRIAIFGNTPIQRLSDFQQSGDFKAETVNTEEDLQIMMMQELSRDILKRPAMPVTFTGDVPAYPTPEANKSLIWNAAADGFENGPDANEIENAQANAEATAADAEQTALDRIATSEDRTATETALDVFTDLFLGPHAADPVTDNDGDPLQEAAFYVNTTTDTDRVFSGGVWRDLGENISAAMLKANNGSDILDVPTFRQSIGLSFGGVGYCRLEFSTSTECRLMPFLGAALPIAGAFEEFPSAGVVLSNSGLSHSTLYYVYAYIDAGGVALEASTTGHVTDGTAGNIGVEIKAGDNSRTLVGMVYVPSDGDFYDEPEFRYVASWYNRRKVVAYHSVTSSNGTYTTTWAELNGAHRTNFVTWAARISGGQMVAAYGLHNAFTGGLGIFVDDFTTGNMVATAKASFNVVNYSSNFSASGHTANIVAEGLHVLMQGGITNDGTRAIVAATSMGTTGRRIFVDLEI